MTIDWPNVVAGAVLAASPFLIVRGRDAMRFYRRSERRKYRGYFYLYHWSGTQDAIRTRRIQFAPSVVRAKTRARMAKDEVTNLAYDGELLRGVGVTYVAMATSGHDHRMFITMYDPVDPEFRVTRGVMSSINLRNQAMCWRVVLSRAELNESEQKDLLGSRTLLTIAGPPGPPVRKAHKPDGRSR